MKTITVNLYEFKELSPKAQDKAISNLYDINVDYEWWEQVYEDAGNVNFKIKEFDLDRRSMCKGEFIYSAPDTAELIIKEHGPDCETYKTAKSFLDDLNTLTSQYDNIEDCPEDEIEELEDEFLKSLQEDYRIMLQHEYEYLTSKEVIIETIEANEYTFTEDGTLKNY